MVLHAILFFILISFLEKTKKEIFMTNKKDDWLKTNKNYARKMLCCAWSMTYRTGVAFLLAQVCTNSRWQIEFFHNSRLIRRTQQKNNPRKLTRDWTQKWESVSHSNHYTRMFCVFVEGCNWVLFMHGWFCSIRLIYIDLIGQKSLHFETKLDCKHLPFSWTHPDLYWCTTQLLECALTGISFVNV